MKVTPLSAPKESKSFEIKQGQEIYKLKIEIEDQNISLILSEDKALLEEYEIILKFEELKQLHKAFFKLVDCHEFSEYIKELIENNKLSIKKENIDHISIEVILEYLNKKNTIKINLKPKALNLELIVKGMFKQLSDVNKKLQKIENNYTELKEENKNLKEESKKIKKENININNKIIDIENYFDTLIKEIIELKNENEILKERISNKNCQSLLNKEEVKINSSIMKQEELAMIKSTIEEKMNLKIKEINRIYQATVDGGEPSNFHEKCDGIKNTLVLYESKGNRRFGGFASETWEDKDCNKTDNNCFLFSLDKNRIFPPKEKNYEIGCYLKYGPCFIQNHIYCIQLLKNGKLKTGESLHKDLFNGEINILSEDGNWNGIYYKDFEVFQIIFY